MSPEAEKELLISKLQSQVASLQNVVKYLDKTVSEVTRRPTPKLPDFVYETLVR